ncbi:DUF3140 domain-containing protein [Phytoactinopolyspora halotolerans]|uniref:DUF3140 domain-containing protein n=1 Tax=Phytoactinopolyspora halotolerans TaxID=1981512 RepID=A0A6L9SD46_9ACTN|nr:DUF3140 domain-containing protein [Phytoactinopolyspora halotolerans]NEE03033.1 DUF3140 domain-containing protein [Phytoactinopolyspora halotolerans]
MAERISPEVDELWERFHQAVNMTSRELLDWLGVEPDLDQGPGPAGRAPLGMAVVSILSKRRTDLTVEDLAVMQKVVDVVDEETSDTSREFLAEDERRRHRLMNVGHDPLRNEQYER